MLSEFFKHRVCRIHSMFVVLLTYFVLLSGCKTFLLKKLYGVKKPRVESEKSILKYASKKGLRQDNIYTFNHNDWKWAVENIPYAKSIPDIIVFDKNGKMLKYREESQCNAKVFPFIASLTKETSFEYDSLLTFKELTSKLKDLKGNKAFISIDDSTDYYVFIFWAVWTGRLNKDHVKEWEKEAYNNDHCLIKVFKVNMDMQDWWDKKH